MNTNEKTREKRPAEGTQPRKPRPQSEGREGQRDRTQRQPASRKEPPRSAAAAKQTRRPALGTERKTPTEEKRRQRPTQTARGAEQPRRTEGERRKQPPRREPSREMSRETLQRREAVQSDAPEQVWQPAGEQSRFAEDAPRERKPQTRETSGQKRQRVDSGYQPYRNANRRKKAARKSAAQRFFSAENPIVAGIKGALEKNRENQAKKREAQAKRKNVPAVIYTDPAPFNRDRLIVEALTVVAVALALVMCMSVFFKVKDITVSGNDVYSPWSIREASGINEGDNLLSFGVAKASGKIIANLPYVESVRIGIKLPDTVMIEVKERKVAYAIRSSDGIWWLMDSDGRVVEMTTDTGAGNYTQILGVTLDSPTVGELAVAAEDSTDTTEPAADTTASTEETTAPTETTAPAEDDALADGVTTVTVSNSQRLQVALEILQALEANDIVGDAASVDVAQLDDIILWYGTRYQVNLGDTQQLEYKIACMNDCVLQLSEYQSGILDISFRTWKTQVGYTPFD